jgi:hypothetical protein
MNPSQGEIEVFERVMTGYYKKPDAQEAAQALSFLLRYTSKWKEDPGNFIMLYFFTRIAQQTDNAEAEYKKVKEQLVDATQKKWLGSVLTAIQHGNPPNPFSRVGTDPSHLDWCWVEFLATGNRDIVAHVAKSLDLPDGIREELESWHLARVKPGILKRLFGQAGSDLKALASVGIEFSSETKSLRNTEDMDFYCFDLADRGVQIFAILPFQLSPELMNRLGAKNAALWSIRNNALYHPIVAECLPEEAQRAGGKARAKLLEPLTGNTKPYCP